MQKSRCPVHFRWELKIKMRNTHITKSNIWINRENKTEKTKDEKGRWMKMVECKWKFFQSTSKSNMFYYVIHSLIRSRIEGEIKENQTLIRTKWEKEQINARVYTYEGCQFVTEYAHSWQNWSMFFLLARTTMTIEACN